jgi:serine/threonine protein kinase
MAESEYRIPLRSDFRFVHEPHLASHEDWFIGREREIEELTRRLQHSDGGSFLITGYRGVGKTSFVHQALNHLGRRVNLLDVHLNIARPVEPAELMHLVIRHLYERLVEKNLYRRLPAKTQLGLTLAYQRTSANVVRKLSESGERGIEIGDFALPGVKLPFAPKLSMKRSRRVDFETSFLAYDDKTAEHDVIAISRALASGVPDPCPWWVNMRRKVFGETAPLKPLKIVFVFDELDKLDEYQLGVQQSDKLGASSMTAVEVMLGGLKTLFTTSGICFVFIAGKDLHERWLQDLWRGDSIYESVFSYDKYLPCMWAELDQICKNLVAEPAGPHSDSQQNRELTDILWGYLRYKGRGTPRRLLRSFNEMVTWTKDQPVGHPGISFGKEDLRRVTFFADLNAKLEANAERLFGISSEDVTGTRQDRRRLGVYYVVDWMLRKGKADFSAAEVLAASHELSARVSLAEEIATDAVVALLEVLTAADYFELLAQKLDDVVVGDPSLVPEKRYRLTLRRLAEMSGIEFLFHDDHPSSGSNFSSNIPAEKMVVGKFVVEEVLGGGGMGTVYRALDKQSKRFVALKVLHPSLNADPSYRDRFLREMRALKTLGHPNIVPFLDAGEADHKAYLAMEFIDGVDLKVVIKSAGHLRPEVALAILLPIAQAIGFAHAKGFFRLDIKPNNIQVSYSGKVYLMDLGIARELNTDSNVTAAGQLIGTPLYMSPEQVQGRVVDFRADIYSFGAVLYEALTGDSPFAANEMALVLQKLLYEEPLSPARRETGIPEWLDRAVLKCLSKDPAERFQSMDELYDCLRNSHRLTLASAEMVASIASESRSRKLGVEYDRNTATQLVDPGVPAPVMETQERLSTSLGPETRFQVAGSQLESTLVPTPRFRWIDPNGVQRYYALPLQATFMVSIGRADDNDIVLQADGVSRYHAQIRSDDHSLQLNDLNSRNGTYVNSSRIFKPHTLSLGDNVQLGEVALTFST